jgi:CRP/FNR family cyclic AMP-dependent transcriptional regulator
MLRYRQTLGRIGRQTSEMPDIKKAKRKGAFNFAALLASAGLPHTPVRYAAGQVIFFQTDIADTVMYLQKGIVKMSVVSGTGKEAVVALLRPRDFFGESCLAGESLRMKRATALTSSAVLVVEKSEMVRLLQAQPALRARLFEHLLATNVRIEADLVDLHVSYAEQRLARTLWLLAGCGKRAARPRKVVPTVSQGTLAAMVGTTRARINTILHKFRQSGFIEMNGELTVNNSLRNVFSSE